MSAGAAPIVWFRGHLIAPDEPVLSVMDHGLLVGDGVFESVRVVGGVPLALDRHLARLERSALAMGLDPPDLEAARAGVDAVLAAGLADPGRLRVTMTSGAGPLGSARGNDGSTMFVIGTALAPVPPSANVAVVEWRRNERGALAGIKSTSYAENALALAAAQSGGADEAIFANTRDELCEGTGSNVFVAVDGELCTPPLSSGCLAGVTRGLVVELTGAREVDLAIGTLAGASEAFLTSTTRGVQPISTVDGRPLPTCPGPLTQSAAAALNRHFGLPDPVLRTKREGSRG